MRVRGTIVVPEWEAQTWYVFLMERATHSMPLPWSRARPTMVDTASGGSDSHGVNRWRFRAFFVDNRGGRLDRLFDHESPPASTVGSKLSRRRLALQDQAEEKLGRPLSRVWAQRELKVLDLCSGLGSVPWTLARLGIQARVFEVELDAAARKVAAARAPGAEQLVPHDIWYWASPVGLKRIGAMGIDLVVGGFPCQSVSIAAPRGRGIKADSKSGVFEAVRRIVMAVREADPQAHFLVECVDFSQRHPADFDAVSEALGVQPWVLDAATISACTRKRAYWASFEAEAPTEIEVDPNSVLEPGRTTWWRKLPTIVASGQSSWNTRKVVMDEWGQAGPLNIGEMEAAMEYDVGYTEAEGLSMRSRFKLIGTPSMQAC